MTRKSHCTKLKSYPAGKIYLSENNEIGEIIGNSFLFEYRVWKINEKTDKKIKKIIEQAKAFMGDSSDEEYDDDSVAKEKELMEKLRKSAKKFEYIELFDKALNAKDLKKDWQIQFLKEGN